MILFRKQEQEQLHCKEISIYLFPEKELRGLSPNFHIHVSLSDLCVSTLGGPPMVGIYKSLTETYKSLTEP
jgi:hypothetical protein